MLGNLNGPTIIAIVLVVIAIIVAIIIWAVRSASKKIKPDPQDELQQAYEAGARQAELQRAYEAGMNAQQTARPADPAPPSGNV